MREERAEVQFCFHRERVEWRKFYAKSRGWFGRKKTQKAQKEFFLLCFLRLFAAIPAVEFICQPGLVAGEIAPAFPAGLATPRSRF